MANKFKILMAMLLAISLGAIIHKLTAIPKSYAAPQNSASFKQAVLQSKDKNVSVRQLNVDSNSDSLLVNGKLADVGDDFIVVMQPSRSFTDNFPTHYIPFTSILRVERLKEGDLRIWIR
jgi:hypothetical protein